MKNKYYKVTSDGKYWSISTPEGIPLLYDKRVTSREYAETEAEFIKDN